MAVTGDRVLNLSNHSTEEEDERTPAYLRNLMMNDRPTAADRMELEEEKSWNQMDSLHSSNQDSSSKDNDDDSMNLDDSSASFASFGGGSDSDLSSELAQERAAFTSSLEDSPRKRANRLTAFQRRKIVASSEFKHLEPVEERGSSDGAL